MNLFNLLHIQIISIATSASHENDMSAFHEGSQKMLNLCNYQNNQKSFFESEIAEGTSKHETKVGSIEKYNAKGLKETPGSNPFEIKGYPNSFDRIKSIEIKPDEHAKVEIEVLNLHGQRIKYLETKQNVIAGFSMHGGDGKNAENWKLFSGIYYVQVNSSGIFY